MRILLASWLIILFASPALAVQAPAGEPLTLEYIERLPVLDFVWDSQQPEIDGWPKEGEEVHWRAWVRNWTDTEQAIDYQWFLDGRELARGSATILAGKSEVFDLPRPWTFERRRLRFSFNGTGQSERSLEVITDALAVGFYVEQSVDEYFRLAQPLLGAGSHSFAEWAQRQIRQINHLFAEAIYPETPDGVLDRLRLDQVILVPDGSLPLDSSDREKAGDRPNVRERRFDLQRGFPASVIETQYRNVQRGEHNPFDLDRTLWHELGHARSLIDVYGYNVYHGVRHSRLEVNEGGEAVAGSAFLPGRPVEHNGEHGLELFRSSEQGLMHDDYSYVDRYSSIALNRIAGQRATHGSFNGSPSIGWFLDDLPEKNDLILKSATGEPLAGAELSIFQDSGDPSHLYAKIFDAEADLVLQADDQGRVDVGRNPFCDKPIRFAKGEFRGVALLRVAWQGFVGYSFLEARRFHLAFWRGATEAAEYEIVFEHLRKGPGQKPEP